jgi:hypothetical protein
MAVTFIASDLIALQVKFAEESKELSDRVHGVFAAPGINYFGSVAVAEGQHRFVTGPAKNLESWPGGIDGRGLLMPSGWRNSINWPERMG